MTPPRAPAPHTCPQCGTQVAAALLACPSCRRLVYGDELRRLAEAAEAAMSAGNATASLAAWREASHLLPPDSRQYETVSTRIADMSRQVDAAGTPVVPKEKPAWAGRWGILGAIAFFLWKVKFVFAFVLTKGKLLLLGLTKGGTLFSMLLSLGIYWQVFGWKFAVGIIVSIYIHEMGHVAMLTRFGIHATAPMFIPGFGALIRSRYYPKDVVADARVGLAGPIWGLATALAAYAVFLATGSPGWGAIAEVGGWINLFNLLPVWQLDGAHGFRALTKRQRWLATAAIGGMWFVTSEGLLLLLLIGSGAAAWFGKPAERPDARALLEYVLLVVLLSLLTTIPVPVGALR